jgi:uncharacterized protein YciI
MHRPIRAGTSQFFVSTSREPVSCGRQRVPSTLATLKQHHDQMHLGGHFENDEGGIVRTLFIVDVENRAAAVAFTENEPFHKAGVFESVMVQRWRQMQPEVSPGANAQSAAAAEMQLKKEGQR